MRSRFPRLRTNMILVLLFLRKRSDFHHLRTVEIFHAKSSSEDYVDSAVKRVLQIHLSAPLDDILSIVTGQEDIEVTCQYSDIFAFT